MCVMNRRTLLLSAGAATLAGCVSAPAALRQFGLGAELDGVIPRIMDRTSFAPGLALAVYTRDGGYARGFGIADMDTGEPANADTAFYIASSTKPLTALALALLHERGDLDLDAALAGFAPDAPFPEAVRPGEVRLRQMLAHTHGIANEPIGFRAAFTGQHDPATMWRLLAACEVNQDAPLGQFQYTNVGYNIATVLTDRQLGVRWQDLLQREIFDAAGMTRASAAMSRAQTANWSIAKPHGIDPDSGRPARIYLQKTDQTMQSAGGVIISANDSLRWLELMCNAGRIGSRQIAPAAAIQATRTPLADVGGAFGDYERAHYGLGWYVGRYRGEPMLHHFGGFAGFRAHVSYLPERGVGVAAYINDASAAFRLVDAIANYIYDRTGGHADAEQRLDAALGDIQTQAGEALARARADLANRAGREWLLTRPFEAYAGAYENDAWGRIEVHAGEDGLHVRYGVLEADAAPFTREDSIRLELVPGMGVAALFVGEGPSPEALVFRSQQFRRV